MEDECEIIISDDNLLSRGRTVLVGMCAPQLGWTPAPESWEPTPRVLPGRPGAFTPTCTDEHLVRLALTHTLRARCT